MPTLPAPALQTNLDQCWLLPKQPPVFVCLGRYGDLILLLPAFLEIHRRTGLKPIVIVSHHYASVLDGVTYVQPEVVKEGWFDGMPKAREMAERKYAWTIVPQWWQDPATAGDMVVDMNQHGARVLQSHGREWGVDCNANPDFGTSMWRRAGFTRAEMITLPLVFDNRDAVREEALAKAHLRSGKPSVLYNFSGVSSPFGYVPEMMAMFVEYKNAFSFVNLADVRAHRIYDLLGLYDRAVGLITIDTSTAHLAPASKVPTVWLTVPGWGRSVPRGNVAAHVPYDEVPKRMGELRAVLNSWKALS